MMDQLASTAGMHALLSIVIELFSIALAWIVIQELKWDAIVKRPRGPQARALQIVLSIVLGRHSRFLRARLLELVEPAQRNCRITSSKHVNNG